MFKKACALAHRSVPGLRSRSYFGGVGLGCRREAEVLLPPVGAKALQRGTRRSQVQPRSEFVEGKATSREKPKAYREVY